MKRKNKSMTVEEHLETADDLAIAAHHLNRIFNRCQEHYPKSHRLMKILDIFCPNLMSGKFITLKSHLDEEWHRVTSNEQFDTYGHPYYGLEERYQKLKGAKNNG